MNTTTPQTPQSLEVGIDAELGVAAAKQSEIARVELAIGQMQTELDSLDGRIAAADAEGAAAELKARLDGGKPPKASSESDSLHGSRRRLLAAVEAARAMQNTLAGQRDEALKVADMLARNIASIEFAEQSRRVADAWVAYGAAFADYSAAAVSAGQPFGWAGNVAFSPQEGLKYEACEGQRIRVLDYDQHVYQAAIGRSNAGRVQAKIDASRA
jgi:hypothetical protein